MGESRLHQMKMQIGNVLSAFFSLRVLVHQVEFTLMVRTPGGGVKPIPANTVAVPVAVRYIHTGQSVTLS